MRTEKINQKEMDAFFEMLKATVSCGGTCAGRHGIGESSSEILTAHTGAETQAAQTAGIYQGNSEPSADDGYPDDEPYWSDSDTNREKWNSIKGR